MSRYIPLTKACVVVSLEESHQSISYGAGDRTEHPRYINENMKQPTDMEKIAHDEGLESMRESVK